MIKEIIQVHLATSNDFTAQTVCIPYANFEKLQYSRYRAWQVGPYHIECQRVRMNANIALHVEALNDLFLLSTGVSFQHCRELNSYCRCMLVQCSSISCRMNGNAAIDFKPRPISDSSKNFDNHDNPYRGKDTRRIQSFVGGQWTACPKPLVISIMNLLTNIMMSGFFAHGHAVAGNSFSDF
jgi:hypothetical protein